jgi:hypothetical protein
MDLNPQLSTKTVADRKLNPSRRGNPGGIGHLDRPVPGQVGPDLILLKLRHACDTALFHMPACVHFPHDRVLVAEPTQGRGAGLFR